jgi:DNA-binding GntR family transcriptional regulator
LPEPNQNIDASYERNGGLAPPGPIAPLFHHVTSAIRQAILQGVLRPSERLVESRLSEQLGVSRGPVREALKQLQNEGLVTLFPRRGGIVSRIQPADVWEVATLRGAVEGLAARLVAERRDTEVADALQVILDEMVTIGDSNPMQFATLDCRFHETLCMAARHKRLEQTWANLRTRIWMFIREVRVGRLTSLVTAITIHQAVVDAIRKGDPVEAERLVRHHSEWSIDPVIAFLKSEPGGSSTRTEQSRGGQTHHAGRDYAPSGTPGL